MVGAFLSFYKHLTKVINIFVYITKIRKIFENHIDFELISNYNKTIAKRTQTSDKKTDIFRKSTRYHVQSQLI